MKKNVLVLAVASMFVVGSAFGQTKSGAEKTTTTEQTQEKGSTEKAVKKEKSSTEAATKGESQKSGGEKSSGNQDQRSAADKAKETTDKMTAELGLDAQQQQKAMQTNTKYFNSIEEMKKSAGDSTDKTQMETKKNQLNEQRMAEFKTFLTPEQYRKLENKAGSSYDEGQPNSTSTSKADKKAKADSMSPEEQERMKEEKQEKKKGGE